MTLNEAVERLLPYAMKSGAATSRGTSRCASVLLHTYNSADWEMRLDEVSLLDPTLKDAALLLIESRIRMGADAEPHLFIYDGAERFEQLAKAWLGSEIHNPKR